MFSDKDIDTQSYMCMNHDAILIDSFFSYYTKVYDKVAKLNLFQEIFMSFSNVMVIFFFKNIYKFFTTSFNPVVSKIKQ